MVRGVILAEWSNSGAGSGLLWKIEIGEKKRSEKGEGGNGHMEKKGGIFRAV